MKIMKILLCLFRLQLYYYCEALNIKMTETKAALF